MCVLEFTNRNRSLKASKLCFKTNRLFKNREPIQVYQHVFFLGAFFVDSHSDAFLFSSIRNVRFASLRQYFAHPFDVIPWPICLCPSAFTPQEAEVIRNDVIVCPSVLFPQQHRTVPTSRIFTDDSSTVANCLRFFFLNVPGCFIDSNKYNLRVRTERKKEIDLGGRGRQLIRREGGFWKENICSVWSRVISKRVISHN